MKTLITLVWLMLFISISFGQSFSVLSIEHRWPDSLKGLQHNVKCILVKDGIIFVGTGRNYLWVSADTGKSWSQRNWRHGLDAPFGTIFALTVTPSGKILAGTEGRIYASTNNGNLWQRVFSGSTTTCFLVTQGAILAGGGWGIFRSINDGITWTKIVDTSLARNVWRMVQTPAGIILAGNFSAFLQQAKGIIRSTDNGQSWNFANNGLSGWGLSIWDLAAYPAGFTGFNSEEVYMVSYYAGAYKSTDGGLNWQHIDEINIIYGGGAIVFPPLGIFLGFSWPLVEPLYYSANGNNWQVVQGLRGYMILCFARYDERRLLVGTHDGLFLITFSPTSVEQTNSLPDFELKQNYPNPFNSSTNIEFSIPEKGFVSLKIYNILGKEIETLVEEEKEAGNHKIQWQPKNLPTGIYYLNLVANNKKATRKMVLLK